MPRLQSSQRASLLTTSAKCAFLDAFRNEMCTKGTMRTARPNLTAIARRVQVQIQQRTGRYYPLYQILSSIHDLDISAQRHAASLQVKPAHPTPPRPLRIMITPNTPEVPEESGVIPPSMSRRRLARNIPTLQCQVPIPPSSLSPFLTSPACATPTLTLSPFFFSRRLSTRSPTTPMTPLDQVLSTPLTPPKLPRPVPAPPRKWARMNAQARCDDPSPLGTPTLPCTPYVLSPPTGAFGGLKPLLGRLQIPGAAERGWLALSPSTQPLSPFDLGKAQRIPEPTAAPGRPVLCRTSSSTSVSLSREALLRAARPSLSRSASMHTSCPGVSGQQATSPLLSPFATPVLAASPFSSQPLASPFAIRPQAVEGGYF